MEVGLTLDVINVFPVAGVPVCEVRGLVVVVIVVIAEATVVTGFVVLIPVEENLTRLC